MWKFEAPRQHLLLITREEHKSVEIKDIALKWVMSCDILRATTKLDLIFAAQACLQVFF